VPPSLRPVSFVQHLRLARSGTPHCVAALIHAESPLRRRDQRCESNSRQGVPRWQLMPRARDRRCWRRALTRTQRVPGHGTTPLHFGGVSGPSHPPLAPLLAACAHSAQVVYAPVRSQCSRGTGPLARPTKRDKSRVCSSCSSCSICRTDKQDGTKIEI
jgi:hypothetical protein